MRSMPIGLFPGLSEMYGGFSIGSHQYLILRSPPPLVAAWLFAMPDIGGIVWPVSPVISWVWSCGCSAPPGGASTCNGVSCIWQIGHNPGLSWITCGCMLHVHNPCEAPAVSLSFLLASSADD